MPASSAARRPLRVSAKRSTAKLATRPGHPPARRAPAYDLGVDAGCPARLGRLWRFEALAGRVRYPGTTETLAAGLRRLRLRRSRMYPLGGSGISPNLFVDSDFTPSACPADMLAHRAARR